MCLGPEPGYRPPISPNRQFAGVTGSENINSIFCSPVNPPKDRTAQIFFPWIPKNPQHKHQKTKAFA